MAKLKWGFKKYIEFLKDYGFAHGHTKGSHYFYNGKINGEERVVQAIHSSKEFGCQSMRTISQGVKNSGIPKKYFEEWNTHKTVHDEIIF